MFSLFSRQRNAFHGIKGPLEALQALLSSRRELPPGIFFSWEARLNELSIFVDESGGQNGTSKYILVTLVFHNQADSIKRFVRHYEESLSLKNLPDISFHASPLMYGKDAYSVFDHETRHRLFSAFFVFVRKLPATYKTFVYRRDELSNSSVFSARFKRDLVVFLVDNLELFQSFDTVKIYYDNGQHMVTEALHGAIEFALSKQAVLYRRASPSEYRLSQVADFLCAVELAALKYENHEETATDVKIFGSSKMFKRNYLRLLRKKSL